MTLKEYEDKREGSWKKVNLLKDNKKKIKLIEQIIILDYKSYKDKLINRKSMAMGITGSILYIFNNLEGDSEIDEDIKFLEEKIFEHSGTLEIPDEYIKNVELEKQKLDEGISELKIQLSNEDK